MDGYTTEQEQVEAIKKWWDENGKSALLGIVLGLGAIFGWRGWQSHIIEQREAASEYYQNSLIAMSLDDRQEARNNINEIITNYGDTGYVVFARLVLAYIETDENNYTAAEEQLTVALDETDNESIRHEITLRLARVYIANNKLDEALSLINSNQMGSFSSQYHELKGDIYALQGKNEDARLTYQQVITESETQAFDTSLVNIKLNSLK